jgi:hypothetical protein
VTCAADLYLKNDTMSCSTERIKRGLPGSYWSFRFGPIILSFWFIVFLNLQSSGEGVDFCFDGSKEGA